MSSETITNILGLIFAVISAVASGLHFNNLCLLSSSRTVLLASILFGSVVFIVFDATYMYGILPFEIYSNFRKVFFRSFLAFGTLASYLLFREEIKKKHV